MRTDQHSQLLTFDWGPISPGMPNPFMALNFSEDTSPLPSYLCPQTLTPISVCLWRFSHIPLCIFHDHWAFAPVLPLAWLVVLPQLSD